MRFITIVVIFINVYRVLTTVNLDVGVILPDSDKYKQTASNSAYWEWIGYGFLYGMDKCYEENLIRFFIYIFFFS